MNLKYQYLGEEISPQQAIQLNKFEKIYILPNGEKKKVEIFKDKEIRKINYYRDENETEEDAIGILSSSGVGYNIITRQNYNTYLIENTNVYLGNIKIGEFKILIDQDNEIICFQGIDIVSNQPIFEETTKHLGHYEDERSTHYCTFHYNADGSLFYCEFNYMSDYDTEEFHQDNIHLIREKFVLTDQMYNYYLTAQFLPPLV
ncbi:hypothetical protein ACFSR6_01120 [Pedobacter vanadiisoli]|uniref:Uncharacterized protein n=1 Tax=Pedobacter vanadiisoli TaxID=1761975 RepID=A0ABW5MFD0_9SPHI